MLMAANHSDSKLKMNPRFWAFCVGRVLWNWTQTDWMEMRLSSQVGGIPVTRVSYGRGGAGLTKLSMPLPVHSRNAAIFLGLICGKRNGRRRSRKVFLRALETFVPQSFELLITAITIILRLQFENTQKAITLLGNLSTFALRTFLGNHRLFLLIIYFHRVSGEKMIGLERGAILIKLRLRRKRWKGETGNKRRVHCTHTGALHCTMCTCGTERSAGLNKLGHILKCLNCYTIQHIFVPFCSVRRSMGKFQFSWASNSNFVIFSQIFPCSNYRAIEYSPLKNAKILRIYNEIRLFPCSIYRAILDTGES